MADKGGAVAATKLMDDVSFYKEISKPGLLILDVYSKWAGPCDSMQAIFRKLLNDQVRFALAQADAITGLAKFRDRSMPHFLFFANGGLVNLVTGANAPVIEKYVKEQTEILRSGGTIANVLGENDLVEIRAPSALPSRRASQDQVQVEDYTLALIKPDGIKHYQEIKDIINKNTFQIVREKKFVFTKEQAQQFYQEHTGKPFFPDLVHYMCSGPMVAFQLGKQNAFKAWRELIGPANSRRAREDAPQSIRALYGTDSQKNAVQGSDSLASAIRECAIVFDDKVQAVELPRSERMDSKVEPQRTLALILPEVVGDWAIPDPLPTPEQPGPPNPVRPVLEEKAVDKVLYAIHRKGLVIDEMQMLKEAPLEKTTVIFGEGELAARIAKGPTLALVLSGDHAIEEWHDLMGPRTVLDAKEDAPESLRGQFAVDEERFGLYGSMSPEDAVRDYNVFFQQQRGATKPSPIVGRLEKTIAMIKPEAVANGHADAIMRRIEESGFTIIRRQEGTLSEEKVKQFYRNNADKPFFNDLVKYMTSGPVVCLILQKENAILAWRELIGPADTARAREVAPNSIRAQFGTDNKQNAVYGSDSAISVIQDLTTLFDAEDLAKSMQQIMEGSKSRHASNNNLKGSIRNLAATMSSGIKTSVRNLISVLPEGRKSVEKLNSGEAAPADAHLPVVDAPGPTEVPVPASASADVAAPAPVSETSAAAQPAETPTVTTAPAPVVAEPALEVAAPVESPTTPKPPKEGQGSRSQLGSAAKKSGSKSLLGSKLSLKKKSNNVLSSPAAEPNAAP